MNDITCIYTDTNLIMYIANVEQCKLDKIDSSTSCICGFNEVVIDKLSAMIKIGNGAINLQSNQNLGFNFGSSKPSSGNEIGGSYGVDHGSPNSLQFELNSNLPTTQANIDLQTKPSFSLIPNLQGIFKLPTLPLSLIQGLPSIFDLPKLASNTIIDIADMNNALRATVPQIVGNVFSNLKQGMLSDSNGVANISAINTLTSIDGSNFDLSQSSSSNDIALVGEKLFLAWLDSHLLGLKLTTSMAAYIRSNALNLFRQIVAQYVDKAMKLGGSLEVNLKRANQLALTNSQELVGYLMNNYINFAGGIMKLIGEKVSWMGKQIDSTGESISTLDLNPMNTASKVLNTLPNPVDYANYFRAYGKQIMSDLRFDTLQNKQNDISIKVETPMINTRPQLTNTLSQTISSWWG